MKTGRNNPCPCGSGKKFKNCCGALGTILKKPVMKYIQRDSEFLPGMKAACKLAKEILDATEAIIKPGISTEEIDLFVAKFMKNRGAYPATLNYRGYPKSSCISLNDVICHGIPSPNIILKEGDILNIDVTPILNGFFGDTSRMYFVGECSEEAKELCYDTKICLDLAIKKIKPYMHIGDIGHVIQTYAESKGYSVVEDFVGHSIGRSFHEEPQIPHFGRKGTGRLILPGMCFTIEPMINIGAKESVVLKDGWTAVTADGSLSAQYEHTVYVTEKELLPLTI